MNTDNTLNFLLKIQKTQNNISLYSAITMGIVLIIYFFTFALLMDKGYKLILMIQVFTSIIFFVSFFYLNRIAFFVTRLIFQKRKPHGEIVRYLSAEDMSKQPEALLKIIDTQIKNNMPT